MKKLRRLERMAITQFLPKERQFTEWLADESNIEVLNDALREYGLELSNPEHQSSPEGSRLNIDVLAEDGKGNPVVIECQYKKSDPRHLGEVLTYLTELESDIGIWIAEEVKSEHVKAIQRLNDDLKNSKFFLLKLEAVRIGSSDPAPLLTLIVGPSSEEGKAASEIREDFRARNPLRQRFFQELLSAGKNSLPLFKGVSAKPRNYIGKAVKNGLNLTYRVRQHSANVELYIDGGKNSEDWNLSVLDTLLKSKNDIEKKFGAQLLWDKKENARACSISKEYPGGYRDEPEWGAIHPQLVEAMVRLKEALEPHLKSIGAFQKGTKSGNK